MGLVDLKIFFCGLCFGIFDLFVVDNGIFFCSFFFGVIGDFGKFFVDGFIFLCLWYYGLFLLVLKVFKGIISGCFFIICGIMFLMICGFLVVFFVGNCNWCGLIWIEDIDNFIDVGGLFLIDFSYFG